ncbi:MAG: protein kinase [Polyangiales bacterium]
MADVELERGAAPVVPARAPARGPSARSVGALPPPAPAACRGASRARPIERAKLAPLTRKPKQYVDPDAGLAPVDVGGEELASPDFLQRYRRDHRLGEGSMGEVVVARDLRVLRDVAMKRLLPAHHSKRPDLRARFLREARVQGQLEHPSVVPVYDIGVDHEGREYFTMKRVHGRTLEEICNGLREGNLAFSTQYSRRRLLTAMSRVCLAVAYAHERGVVHRDLKPANIMLGDYGEVHLLDWGIAKIAGVDDPLLGDGDGVDVGDEVIVGTEAGFVVGTPGYMAPEQARGETRTYGGRSDIYSLGAILFEALTHERMHPQVGIEAIMLSTLRGAEVRPSVRAPGIGLPPELDAILQRATALDPEHRYRSARELNDDIERLLDGDRDSTRRAAIAAQHVARAQRALVRAQQGGAEADGQHRRAVGELLAALALEPRQPEAHATMRQLLLEPVERLPDEAYGELAAIKRRDRARGSRNTGWAFLAWMGTFPLIAAMGVRDQPTLLTLGAMLGLLIAYKWWMAATDRTQAGYMVGGVIGSFACVAVTSMFFGPLFLVPGLSVTAATSYLVALRADRRTRWLVMLGSLGSVLLPTLGVLGGVLPARYSFDAEGLTILPGLVRLPERATWAFLLMVNCLTVVIANLLVSRAVAQLLQAERRLFAQAWRLRQFLPELTKFER